LVSVKSSTLFPPWDSALKNIGAVPVLVTVTVCGALAVPTGWGPKLSDGGLIEAAGAPLGAGAGVGVPPPPPPPWDASAVPAPVMTRTAATTSVADADRI
jgi:hypothetical protein